MATTDFARFLTRFFAEYLVTEKGTSPNTIRAYSDTFTLLLTFMDEIKHIKADRLLLDHIKKEVILQFLDWLQSSRRCGNATRNQRLAAIHSFFAYLQVRRYQTDRTMARYTVNQD
jgi:site-specific recombinase XerD